MKVSKSVAFLRKKLGRRGPRVALVLGSSLGKIAELVEEPLSIPYGKVPGFPRPGVSGHAGVLLAGRIGANETIVLNGRAHPYEKGDPAVMRPAIAALAELGVGSIILLNAAGSLMPGVGPGRLMLITDHVNFSGMNPLIGEKGDARFVSLIGAYDATLSDRLRSAAQAEGIELSEGTYMWFSGPSFETPAEIRAARILGADAVGMSTVPEVLLARRFGLKVAAISVITNYAAGIAGAVTSHDDTKRQGAAASGTLSRLLASAFDRPLDA